MHRNALVAALSWAAPALLALVGAVGTAQAEGTASAALYQVVVPVKGTTEADRTAAFGDAIRTVAVRVSGDRSAGGRGSIAAAATKPARYVQQYSAASGRLLKVGLEPRAMEQLVLEAGLPVWPAERPTTLVLLLDSSSGAAGRAQLATERSPARDAIEKTAEQRGVRVVWPATEVAATVARDGTRALSLASAAGSTPAAGVLIGEGSGTAIAWRYRSGDIDVSGRGGGADGVHLLADALAERYAPSSTRDIARESVVVAGIADLGAYADVLDYLGSLSLVRRVDVDEASGDSLRLGVTLRGDRALLRRVVGLGRVLDVAVPVADGAADFVYTR